MYSIFLLLIGAFIGWNIPQPSWAQNIGAKLKEKLKSLFSKKV